MPIKFTKRIKKWGNSYVFAVPKEIIEALSLKIDDEVSVSLEGDKIIVEKNQSIHDG